MRFVLVLLLVGVFACQEGDPSSEEIIPEGEFVELMVEIQLIEAYCQNRYVDPKKFDELLHRSVDSILVTEGYSKEQFEASFDFYSRKPEKMFRVYESVLEKINELQIQENSTSQ